ncbi:hypothetical protein FXO37_25374 [Capsicum annuum]|nr:hypothetical protein FXO37_25374 [Capsicum annuum]
MQQQGDETPMVKEMLMYIYILYSPDWLFAIVHSQLRFGIGFKVHYALLCLLCSPRAYKYYIHTEDKLEKRLAKLYVVTLLIIIFLVWAAGALFQAKARHKEALVALSVTLSIEPDYIPSIISTVKVLMKMGNDAVPVAKKLFNKCSTIRTYEP